MPHVVVHLPNPDLAPPLAAAGATLASGTGADLVLAMPRQVWRMDPIAGARWLDELAERYSRTNLPTSGYLTEPRDLEAMLGGDAESAVAVVAIPQDPNGDTLFPDEWVRGVSLHNPRLVLAVPPEHPRLDQDPDRVLVPLDGTTTAESALTSGLAWVDPDRTSLHLLRVVPGSAPGYAVRRAGGVRARRYLEEQANRLRADGWMVRTEVRRGADVAETIRAVAEADSAGLILLSTRRPGRPGTGPVVGRTVERVLRTARRPTLIVRPCGCRTEAPARHALARPPERGVPRPLAPSPATPDSPTPRHPATPAPTTHPAGPRSPAPPGPADSPTAVRNPTPEMSVVPN